MRSGEVQIGLGGTRHMPAEGLVAKQVGGVRIVPVAHPDHALAQAAANVPARDQLQIAPADPVEADRRPCVVLSSATWRVGDLASARALPAGFGWAVPPEPLVQEDVEAGRLRRLDLPDLREGRYPMQIVRKLGAPPGPAGSWLIERLAQDLGPLGRD